MILEGQLYRVIVNTMFVHTGLKMSFSVPQKHDQMAHEYSEHTLK